jgi:hypothetical protein
MGIRYTVTHGSSGRPYRTSIEPQTATGTLFAAGVLVNSGVTGGTVTEDTPHQTVTGVALHAEVTHRLWLTACGLIAAVTGFAPSFLVRVDVLVGTAVGVSVTGGARGTTDIVIQVATGVPLAKLSILDHLVVKVANRGEKVDRRTRSPHATTVRLIRLVARASGAEPVLDVLSGQVASGVGTLVQFFATRGVIRVDTGQVDGVAPGIWNGSFPVIAVDIAFTRNRAVLSGAVNHIHTRGRERSLTRHTTRIAGSRTTSNKNKRLTIENTRMIWDVITVTILIRIL